MLIGTAAKYNESYPALDEDVNAVIKNLIVMHHLLRGLTRAVASALIGSSGQGCLG